MKLQTLIFFGRSGSGKGTQANRLIKFITDHDKDGKVLHIEIGQKLREFAVRDNYTAKLTQKVMNEGGLLPVFMPTWTWTNLLIEKFTGEEHLLMEGLVRHSSQAEILDSALKFYNLKNPTVILINVSSVWAKERLLERGRVDDTSEAIDRRMAWFGANVVPVIDYFRNNGYYKLIEINGEQPVEKVHQDIVSMIDWKDD